MPTDRRKYKDPKFINRSRAFGSNFGGEQPPPERNNIFRDPDKQVIYIPPAYQEDVPDQFPDREAAVSDLPTSLKWILVKPRQ